MKQNLAIVSTIFGLVTSVLLGVNYFARASDVENQGIQLAMTQEEVQKLKDQRLLETARDTYYTLKNMKLRHPNDAELKD